MLILLFDGNRKGEADFRQSLCLGNRRKDVGQSPLYRRQFSSAFRQHFCKSGTVRVLYKLHLIFPGKPSKLVTILSTSETFPGVATNEGLLRSWKHLLHDSSPLERETALISEFTSPFRNFQRTKFEFARVSHVFCLPYLAVFRLLTLDQVASANIAHVLSQAEIALSSGTYVPRNFLRQEDISVQELLTLRRLTLSSLLWIEDGQSFPGLSEIFRAVTTTSVTIQEASIALPISCV